MARNKASRFGAEEGLFAHEIQQVEKTNVQQVQEVDTISTRSTQGRKGCKMPRINMAFEPDNHVWIKKTAMQRGMSMTDLVNQIVSEYRRK